MTPTTRQPEKPGHPDLPEVLVRRRWDRLTDEDIELAGGDRARLARRIAKRYRITVTEARRQVQQFARTVRATWALRRGRKRIRKAHVSVLEALGDKIAGTLSDLRTIVLSTNPGGLLGSDPDSQPLPDDDDDGRSVDLERSERVRSAPIIESRGEP